MGEGTRYTSNPAIQEMFFSQRPLVLAVAQLATFDVNKSREFFPPSIETLFQTESLSHTDNSNSAHDDSVRANKIEMIRWKQWRNLMVRIKILALAVLERVVHSSPLNQQMVGDMRLPITKQCKEEDWVLSFLMKMECFPPSLTTSTEIMGQQDGAVGRVCMVDGPLGMDGRPMESMSENEALKAAAGRVLDVFVRSTEVGKLIVVGHTITPPPTETWEKTSSPAGRILSDRLQSLTDSCLAVSSSGAENVSKANTKMLNIHPLVVEYWNVCARFRSLIHASRTCKALALKIEVFGSIGTMERSYHQQKDGGSAASAPVLLFCYCLHCLSVAIKNGGLCIQVALFRILFEWIRECPEAIRLLLGTRGLFLFQLLCKSTADEELLSSSSSNSSSQSANEEEMVHCHGLAAIILGMCLVYMEKDDSPTSRKQGKVDLSLYF